MSFDTHCPNPKIGKLLKSLQMSFKSMLRTTIESKLRMSNGSSLS